MALIERVTIHRRLVPLKRPFVTAVRTAHAVDALVVEVLDGDGRSGWGEAPTSWRVTGESIPGVTAAVSGPLSEAVVGLPSDEPESASLALERAVVRNSSARMALDCALFDLAARAAGVPLFRYLGGQVSTVRTDMTLSAAVTTSEIDELVRTATEHVAAGFRTLKVKAGAHGGEAKADDVKTLIEVRRAVGDGVELRVDANQGWSPEDAVRIIGALEDSGVGIEFVEQPVHRDDVDGLAFVTERVRTPIMADETVWTRRDLKEVVNRHASDLVNIKLAKTGGLREAVELAGLARASEVGVVVGCMSESHVGIAAAAALASALDGYTNAGGTADNARGTADNSSNPGDPDNNAATRSHDLDGGLWLTHSPVDGGIEYDGEQVLLADAPGTGIAGLVAL